MKIKLDYGSQWNGMHCLDFINIGIYRSYTLNSLCFTFMGFYIDIDFEMENKNE